MPGGMASDFANRATFLDCTVGVNDEMIPDVAGSSFGVFVGGEFAGFVGSVDLVCRAGLPLFCRGTMDDDFVNIP